MKWLENLRLRTIWKIRRVFRMKKQTIAPIQWDEPLLKALPDRTLGGILNDDQIRRFESIVREVRTISMLTKYFPSKITDEEWQILLECQTRKQRFDHVKFLRNRELEKIKDMERKRAKGESMKFVEKMVDYTPPLYYPATKLVKDQRRRQWYKVALAHLCDAPRIVIDCRFLPLLSPRGAELTAVQLSYLISENRDSKTPWQLYFTNVDLSEKRFQRLRRKHLSVIDSSATCSPAIFSASYTEIFPRERIVYLSPDAEEELIHVDDDKIYVLGGIVDRVAERGIPHHASFETAKADGVSCKKLPLDKYVKWKSGTRYLTLTAVCGILRDVNNSDGDWESALLKHIPVRNVKSAEEKSLGGRILHEKIRQFDQQLLQIVEREIGKEVLTEQCGNI